ncbi:MAG: hypothetical protein ACTHKY_02605, partial [Ginsengibacter sp.]
MGNSFFKYVQQLELFGFFSGYSLIFVLILFWTGDKPLQNNFKKRLLSVIPYSYALIGTLYIGLLMIPGPGRRVHLVVRRPRAAHHRALGVPDLPRHQP